MNYIIVIVAIFILEWCIKGLIEVIAPDDLCKPILKGRIVLRKFHNRGAMLNLGNKRRRIVAAVSFAFTTVMCIVFLMTLTTRGNTCFKLGMAFLLGGAFSNTYDRLKRKYVVDYFSIRSRSSWFSGIVFNIADFCIALGAVMTALAVIMNPDI